MQPLFRHILILGTITFLGAPSLAHPGGTDADGCHVCHKECARWDETAGTRHCHGEENEQKQTVQKTEEAQPRPKKRVRVRRVIDGDTIEVVTLGDDPVEITVRLKGIDCPESHRNAKCIRDGDCDTDAPKGKAASRKMTDLVAGEIVTLHSAKSTFEKDRYGRLLAYVHLGGTDVGLHLIRGGYCHDFSDSYPHPRQKQYREAEP